MYINPFIAGILATIMSECVIVIAHAIHITLTNKKNNGGKR